MTWSNPYVERCGLEAYRDLLRYQLLELFVFARESKQP